MHNASSAIMTMLRHHFFRRYEAICGWIIFGIGVSGFIIVLLKFATYCPRHDDWILIQSFASINSTGLLASLLEPHNVHPIPLTKAIIWLLWGMFGISAVPTTIFSALVISGAAGLVFGALNRDLDFPAGHAALAAVLFGPALPSLVGWPTLVSFAIIHSLICLCMVAIRKYFHKSRSWWSAFLPLFLLGLAGCGIPGLVIALIVGCGVTISLFHADRSQMPRAVLVWNVICLFGLVAYAVLAARIMLNRVSAGLENPGNTGLMQMWHVTNVTLQVLANAFGDAGKLFFPASSFVTLIIYVCTIYLLIASRDLGGENGNGKVWRFVLAFLVASYLAVALVIGIGRSFQGGFAMWYFGLFGTSWIVVFVSWIVLAEKGARGHWSAVALMLACVVFPWMWGESIRNQRMYLAAEKALVRDIRDGLPVSGIAARNQLGFSKDTLVALRDLNAWPFREVSDDPEYEIISVDPRDGELLDSEQDGAGIVLRGEKSGILFRLPTVRKVALVRIKFDLLTSSRSNNFRLFVVSNQEKCSPAAVNVVEKNAYFWKPSHRRNAELVFWLDQEVESFAILPSENAGTFRLHLVELYCRK